MAAEEKAEVRAGPVVTEARRADVRAGLVVTGLRRLQPRTQWLCQENKSLVGVLSALPGVTEAQ